MPPWCATPATGTRRRCCRGAGSCVPPRVRRRLEHSEVRSSCATRAEAAAPGIGLALPIPATLDLLGEDFHVQAPPLTGVDTDPATVNNFQGAAGIAFISGTVERTDRKTGETRVLPYLFNDMRFMQGVFRGRDGHERDATFALHMN